MKLTSLFSSVAIDEFSSKARPKLHSFLSDLNRWLLSSTLIVKDIEVANLFEAYTLYPEILAHVEALYHRDLVLHTVILNLGFQAAWLMDGGELGLFGDKSIRYEAREAYNWGAHYLLMDIGYTDVDLSLKGVCHYLHHLYDQETYTHGLSSQQPVSSRLSLQGFLGKPCLPSDLSSGGMQIYVDNYLSESARRKPLSPIDTHLVRDTLLAWSGHHELDSRELYSLLRHMVYNPGLRFKAHGFSASEIILHLSPVIQQISDVIEPIILQKDRHFAGKAFERQVLINLLSPFVEDMAFLDARIEELMGNPPLSMDQIPDLLRNTYQGPLGVFNPAARGDVYDNYKRLNLPIDIDMIMSGTLASSQIAKEILSDVGRSTITDRLLSDFFIRGPENHPDTDVLLEILESLRFEDHDFAGKVALLAVSVMNTTLSRDTMEGEDLEEGAWRWYHLQVSEKLQVEPALGDPLLAYLERHELLDPEILQWCGFQSDILSKLKSEPSHVLIESYFAKDLGL